MGHDSFKPTNQKESTTEISPKKVGTEDDPVEETHAKTSHIDDQTINDSVTYPDGTTVTTSPGGLWTKDGSISSATSSSHTFNLNSNYDLILVQVTQLDSSNNNVLQLQVDGATGGYNELAAGGSVRTGNSQVDLASSINNAASGNILISGRFQNRAGIFPQLSNVANDVVRAEAPNATSPLDSVTLKDGGGQNFTLSATFYGYDGA